MKAVGYRNAGPVSDSQALEDITLPFPVPTGRDIRVAVRAVSVNPVDTKIRRGVAPPPGEHKVVGWDAAGVVDAVGAEQQVCLGADRLTDELAELDAELHRFERGLARIEG